MKEEKSLLNKIADEFTVNFENKKNRNSTKEEREEKLKSLKTACRILDYEIVSYVIKKVDEFEKRYSEIYDFDIKSKTLLKAQLLKEIKFLVSLKKDNGILFYYKQALETCSDNFFEKCKDFKMLNRKPFP